MATEMNERAVSIRRLTEGPKPAYRVFVEGVTPEPVILKGQLLNPVLDVIYKDAAASFKEVIDDVGQLVASPWLTPGEETLLRVQIPAYAFISSR